MLIPKSNNPRCVGINGWLLEAVIEENDPNTKEVKAIKKSILGSENRNSKIDLESAIKLGLIKLEENQKLVSHEITFCGCDRGLLEFANGCADPRLSKISSSCQKYEGENSPTVIIKVHDYYIENDDKQILALYAMVLATPGGQRWCHFVSSGADSNVNYLRCENDPQTPAWDALSGLRHGYWVYKDERVQVNDYFQENDQARIDELTAIIEAGCGGVYYDPGSVNPRRDCNDAAKAAAKERWGTNLKPGVWITKDSYPLNPYYDPDWLAVNKRIFRLTESKDKNALFTHGSRTIVEKIDGKVTNVYYWHNFITKIEYKFCDASGGEHCNANGVYYRGWYAIIEYECSNVSAAGEFQDGLDPGAIPPKCGKCEITSTPKPVLVHTSIDGHWEFDSVNQYGSATEHWVPAQPGVDVYVQPPGCCTDMRLLTEFFNTIEVPSSGKTD